MKRRMLFLSIALLLVITACNRPDPLPQTTEPSTSATEPTTAPPPEDGLPAPSEETVEKTYAAENADKTELLRVALRVPTFPGGTGAWEQINIYYADRLEDLSALCEFDVLESVRARYHEAVDAGTQFEPSAVEASYEIMRRDARVLSVMRQMVRSEGDEIREILLLPETFSMENGGKMSIYDLFPGEENAFMPKLTELVLTGLKAQSAVLLDQGFEANAMARLQPTDFVLTEDGVTLWWQSGAISKDQPAFVTLTYQALDGLLDARWLPEEVK